MKHKILIAVLVGILVGGVTTNIPQIYADKGNDPISQIWQEITKIEQKIAVSGTGITPTSSGGNTGHGHTDHPPPKHTKHNGLTSPSAYEGGDADSLVFVDTQFVQLAPPTLIVDCVGSTYQDPTGATFNDRVLNFGTADNPQYATGGWCPAQQDTTYFIEDSRATNTSEVLFTISATDGGTFDGGLASVGAQSAPKYNFEKSGTFAITNSDGTTSTVTGFFIDQDVTSSVATFGEQFHYVLLG